MLRPPLRPSASSSSSVSVSRSPSNASASIVPLFAELTFYVVPAKLEGAIASVYAQIDALGGQRTARAEDADYVLTALHGIPRLERVLGRNLVRCVLDDSLHPRPRSTSSASSSSPTRMRAASHQKASPACQAGTSIVSPRRGASARRASNSSTAQAQPRRRKLHLSLLPTTVPPAPGLETGTRRSLPTSPRILLRCRSRTFPSLRASAPVHSPARTRTLCASPRLAKLTEQIDAIKPIFEEREYDEPDQLNSNVLSYRRSMSVGFVLWSR